MRYEEKPYAVVVDMSQFCGTDNGNTQQALLQVVTHFPARKRLVLEFAAVESMSSSLIGVLVLVNRVAKQHEVDMRLRNLNQSVMEVYKIAQLDKIFSIGTGNYGEDEPPELTGSPVPRPKPLNSLMARASPPSVRNDLPKTYVTNMDHQLDESGELSPQLPSAARKIASFNTLLIDQATQLFPADDQDSGIRCRTKECQGAIHVTLADRADDLEWHCPTCGLNGRISNWQGTKWDRTLGGG